MFSATLVMRFSFRQKSTYAVRISDWSSDVCSSDLVDPGCPLTIGQDVTVGHQAMLHGCTIHDGALVGIQAVVLNNAVIGKNCLVGAGAVVTEGKSFPERSLILGAPATVVRTLSDEEEIGRAHV